MENFFNWMSKPIPKEEVLIWFNIHNLNYEKIELYGDFYKTLNHIIVDTYLGNDSSETRIIMSEEDKESHFEWCWEKVLDNFSKENIKFSSNGTHKDYFKTFFMDAFYNPKEKNTINSIPEFIEDVFNVEKVFTKSDLDILTEIYQVMEKNME